MAFDETDVPTAHQPSSSEMTGATSPPPLQPPTTTAATMMNRDRRATSPSPSWLRSNRPAMARSGQSPSVARTLSGQPPFANRERTGASIGTAMRPQQHNPNASRHALGPPATAHPVIPLPASPHLSLEPSVAGATKRKAPMEALGTGDRQDRRVRRDDAERAYGGGTGGAGVQVSGGGTRMTWISEEEGTKIMMEAKAMKNLARRVTTSGGETHGKRTKRAAAASEDETDTRLSWRRKTGGMPPPVTPSGPLRNSKGIGVNAAVCCKTPDRDLTAPPENGGFDLSIASEAVSSGKISDSLGPATLVEEMAVSRDNVQADLSPVSGQSLRAEMNKGRRNPSIMTEQRPHCPECKGICTDPAHDMSSLTPLNDLSQNELGPPDVAGPHALESADDTSDSDVPLSLSVLFSQSRAPRLKPRSGNKGKSKARTDELDVTYVDASLEGAPLDGVGKLVFESPLSGHVNATATADVPDKLTHKRAKVKSATRNSDSREQAGTPRRKRHKLPRAQNSDASEDCGSEDNLVPRARPVRASTRANATWRVVEPPRSAVRSAKRPLAPLGLRPREWAGGKDELFAALPALAKNQGGVAWDGLHATLIFSEGKSDPGLGWWTDDAWDGRKITFLIVREIDLPLNPSERCSVSTVHDPPSEIESMIKDKETHNSSSRAPKAGPSQVHRFEVDRSSTPQEPNSSGVQPPMELTYVNGPTTFDSHSPLVDTHSGRPSHGVKPSTELLTTDPPSCSAPAQIRKSPVTNTRPSSSPHSSELPDANSIQAPDKSGPGPTSSHPDIAMGCGVAPVPPRGSGDLHHLPFPQPPPEVAALLTAQSAGDVVTPIFARNSPLVPWGLPSEIGHFWLGLFKISEVKVETRSWRSTSNSLTAHRAWRFVLDWVPGGEDLLLDDEQDDYREWSLRTIRPWWEPAHTSPEQNPSVECSRLLLPLPLLAPFTENSTATGYFPVGYFCATCGRVNVQRLLRHRICESATCSAKVDLKREIGWVTGAFSTRDRKVNSATISPDDKWAAPTTAEPAIGFEDGARLFHYHLAAVTPTLSDESSAPVASGSRSIVDDSNSLSVRHIFNGNRAPLQAGASALFETLQRDVPIERSIGSTVFSTPVFESGDDPALPCNGRGVWNQQSEIIEDALRAYCCDLGPLRAHSLRIHTWISDGKHRQTFCSRVKYLVLLCLGADISLLSILADSASDTKSTSKGKEILRVTMVHGDIVVLSGSKFEFLMVRTGMCMLLEVECI